MIIDEQKYMGYNIPALLAFSAGLFVSVFRKKYTNDYKIEDLSERNQEDYRKNMHLLLNIIFKHRVLIQKNAGTGSLARAPTHGSIISVKIIMSL